MTKLLFSIIVFLLLSPTPTLAQQEVYSRVRIYINNANQISEMFNKGILLDHYSKGEANSIDAEISTREIQILKNNNYQFTVLVPNVKEHYLKSVKLNSNQKTAAPICGLQNLEYGSMGHYHTFSEVVSNLDSMAAKYPNIITAKNYIGTSIEGRPIYSVKISDNPYVDESATEGIVYFDALHHAREPLSMESLLYYMWWLLENYNNDAEATYLINKRELHFIPVVNPDGYVYNETTDPGGGGMWRKNRRDNGNGSFGVDLNRNYSSGFGDPTGASNVPSSGTYHGDSAFSEPEAQAVRDYVMAINPSISFTVHTSGQKFLISPGCFYPKEDYESYSEFSSEFINNSFFGYGTTFEMLNYSSCGTSRHFMHDMGIYSWVPELGTSFWPAQSEYCSTVQNFQGALKYISKVSGSFTRLNDFSVGGNGSAIPNDTLTLNLRLKNRGLTFNADSVTVIVEPLSPNCTSIDSSVFISSIDSRDYSSITVTYFLSSNANVLDPLEFKISIQEKDFTTHIINKTVYVGQKSVLFADDSESGTSNWISSDWDTTFIDKQSGLYSFADTRYGSYESNDNTAIELLQAIDLSGTLNPRLLFNSKWSLDFSDDVNLEISTNGFSWTNLESFTEHHHWTFNMIDLSGYVGQTIYLRFRLSSDASVQSDGFYFDDFEVVDFSSVITSISELNQIEGISIYPNPTSDFIQVTNEFESNLTIELFNYTAQSVLLTNPNKQLTKIDIRNFAAGIYFIKISNSESELVKKIVVN